MEIEKKTIYKDEELLRTQSRDVKFNNTKYTRYIKDMKKFCSKNGCSAISAVQIGIPERIIYLNEGKGLILINPVIESEKGVATRWEDNISCGDIIGLVKRPYEIVVKFFNEDGEEYIEIYHGLLAADISHHIDLLDGILFIDIADQLETQNTNKRAHIKESNPYKVISETCDFRLKKNLTRKRNIKK